MITEQEREILIEAAAAAHRAQSPDGLVPNAAWHDLNDDDRARAFEIACQMREIEAGLDQDHLSKAAHAVLDRIG